MDPDYQQAVTAAGMGSMAALDAEEWIEASAGTSGDSVRQVSMEADD